MQIDIRCSYNGIKNKQIIDSEGKKVGRIIDAVFNDKLELTKFVIGGSRLEEWLENRGLRPDIDPLVPISTITKVADKIHLSVNQDTLKTTIDKEGFAENERKFSQITNYPILDSAKENVGLMKSFCINPDQSIEFVIFGDDLNPRLLEKHTITGLLYAFTNKEMVSNEGNQFRLSTSLDEIEHRLKHDINLALIHSTKVAWKDGRISEDEMEMLKIMEVNAETYQKALLSALSDNIITQEEEIELEELKEDLIHAAYTTAMRDKIITKDEGAIIDRVANYMIDKRKKIFWKTFGTYKDSR